MATSMSSVDGLISGMSTSDVVRQLMMLEAQPQDRLVRQSNTLTTKVAAYQKVNTKFLALQDAADKLTKPDTWAARSTSSSTPSVTATASSGALTGSLTFDVQQVAKSQAYVSQGTFSSTSAVITGATTLTISKGSVPPVDVNVGDGSLAAVVAGINTAGVGIRAAAVQVAPGTYKLQLTSTTSGADGDFSIAAGGDTAPLGALVESVHGQDAVLVMGDPSSPGRYTVSSHTNTFNDVLPGINVTVTAPATAVTIDVIPAGGQLATDVAAMITAANAVLGEIKTQTAFDPATKTGSVLTGDSLMRSLQQQVLGMISSATGAGVTPGTAGISVLRDGTIGFDATKFQASFAADPDGTAALFMPGGTVAHADPGMASLAEKVMLLKGADQMVPGSYEIKVTAAARQSRLEVSGTLAAGEQLTLTVPGKDPVVITAQPGDDLDALAVRINEAAASGTLGVVARVEAGILQVRSTVYGPEQSFTLTTDGTATIGALVPGANVAGTVNGVPATGTGQTLMTPTDDVALRGASFFVTATEADVALAASQVGAAQNLFGSFTYAPGLAQRFDSLAGDVVRTGSGRLSQMISGKQDQIDRLGIDIEDWDRRLEQREATLKRQYANLETALGKLKSQGTWLSGQIASLPTYSSSS